MTNYNPEAQIHNKLTYKLGDLATELRDYVRQGDRQQMALELLGEWPIECAVAAYRENGDLSETELMHAVIKAALEALA